MIKLIFKYKSNKKLHSIIKGNKKLKTKLSLTIQRSKIGGKLLKGETKNCKKKVKTKQQAKLI